MPPAVVFRFGYSPLSKILPSSARSSSTSGCGLPEQRPPPADFIATESIGGVLPQVAEDLYPYDQTAWDSDEPA